MLPLGHTRLFEEKKPQKVVKNNKNQLDFESIKTAA